MSPSSNTPRRILLAAGGTGGHINPAVALAQALAELAPDVQTQFICGSRPTEWQVYRRQGIEPWIVPIGAQRPGLLAKLGSLGAQARAYLRARGYLARSPVQVAVGFGSYASVGPMLAARAGGAKLVLHEQNVKPGLANRLLTPFATRVATAEPLPEKRTGGGKYVHVGNPVRTALLRPVDRAQARAFFRMQPGRLVCLCTGGSQGARGINRMLLELALRLAQAEHAGVRWQLLWSTGPAHYDAVVKALAEAGIDPSEHCVNPYLDEMALAYGAADLVLGRAGALTLAEITALGKPSILIPLATSAGGHQEANARALAGTGAAELLIEADPQAVDKLESWLTDWAANPGKLAAMAAQAAELGRPQAAHELARVVLELLD